MSCSCVNAKILPNCITSLIVGTATGNTDYNVCFETSTGRIDVYPVTSDSDGVITITDGMWRVDENYEVWVSRQDGNLYDKEYFTVSSESVTCLNVMFRYANATFSSQEIEVV